MKKIFLSLLLTFVAVILIACSDTVQNDGQTYDFSNLYREKETITVWIDDQGGEYMQAVIEAFNKTPQGANIVVQHQHMGSVESRERLKTFGLTGNGADIFQFPHDHLASAITEDLVYALPTDVATRVGGRVHELGLNIATLWYDETNQSFDPNSANATQRLYAVPMSLETIGLYYNKNLITTPATTYEQIITEGTAWNTQKAVATGPTNAERGLFYLGTSNHFADSYFMQHIYSAFGFTPFGPNLNNPAQVGFANATSALNWMVNSLKPITTGNGNHNSATGGTNFVNGQIPYIIAGPWNIEEYSKATNVDLGIAPLPTINGQATRPFAGAQMAAIYKYSNNKEAATAFLEFLASDEAMQLQFAMKYKLPALKEALLANIEGFSADENMVAISNQLKSAVPMPTIPEVQYYWGPGESMIISVWNNGVAAGTATATAEAAYQAQLGLGSN